MSAARNRTQMHRPIKTYAVVFLLQCHPDTSQTGKGDTARFQSIMEAYRVLSKEDLRADYDAQFTYARSRFDDPEYMDHLRRDSNIAYQHDFAKEARKARAREKYYEE